MKRFLFFGILAALLLGTASCSSDMEPVNGDGNVTFTVQLGDNIDSRTIADGTGANTLMFAVFTADGQHLTDLDQTLPIDNKMATVTTKLASNRSYKIVFWAQNSACDAYDTSDISAIKVNYENIDCNDETRDAFYKLEEVTIGSEPFNTVVVLTRPFAQINFLASDKGSVDDFSNYEYDMTVTNVPTQLNTLDGTVGGEPVEVLLFNQKPVVGETLAGYENYEYLTMNYILAAPEKELKTEVTMTVYDNAANKTKTFNVENCPVQRNYRTNIIGDFHSTNSHFYVQVHPMFNGDFFKPNGIPASEVAAAVTVPGATVVVEAGSELELNLSTIAEGVTLDLNGSTLKFTVGTSTLHTVSANNVTIENGTIDNYTDWALRISTKTFTLKNVDIVGNSTNGIHITGTGNPETDAISIIDCNFEKEIRPFFRTFMIYGTSKIYVNRCTFNGCYSIHSDGSNCPVLVENSTVAGWTPWNNGDTHNYVFNKCKFAKSIYPYYGVIRPYKDSYFNECIFEETIHFSPRGGNAYCTNCTFVDLNEFLNGEDGYETNAQALSSTITIDGVKYINRGLGYWEKESDVNSGE